MSGDKRVSLQTKQNVLCHCQCRYFVGYVGLPLYFCFIVNSPSGSHIDAINLTQIIHCLDKHRYINVKIYFFKNKGIDIRLTTTHHNTDNSLLCT